MRRRLASVLALVGSLSLAACGDSGGKAAGSGGGGATPAAPAASSSEGAVRARLEAFFAAVGEGPAKAASFIAYRGPDEARRYKAPAKYEGDEQRQVDRVVERVKGHLAAGAATFEKSEARSKGAEKWVAWHVTFGAGDAAKKALYAFVETPSGWLLGDID
ncbi:MAG: hypothetical protein IT460_14890 [Planctomycetes bacterium]|nr:hypothetical protein [Planctomycetota bacterium]